MAAHVRTSLRQAVKAALDNLPTTASRVFAGRTWPTDDACYPGLLIYARGGPARIDAQSDSDVDRPTERDERLVVEGIVRTRGVEPDDLLDQIELEVAAALLADPTVAGLAEICEPLGAEISARAGGEHREGSIKLNFRVVYRTPAGDLSLRL